MRLRILIATMLALAGVVGGSIFLSAQRNGPSPITSVHVVGNHLVNQAGDTIRLLGVNRSGTEYTCLSSGIFYGPTGHASIEAMTSWDITAVRIPLNEDCWLGINGVTRSYSGERYRAAIQRYVRLLNAAGLVAILDLHWNAPGRTLATGQRLMADQSHSPAFWTSVARTFKSTPDVVFDLYNEPYGISWECWLDGCRLPEGWTTAGMQELVNDVRGAGATQPIMVGGLNHASDLSQWLAYEPKDPLHQLVASVHIYDPGGCDFVYCWTQVLETVAKKVPVVTGELGEFDCGQSFIDGYMAWADKEGISYLAWAWDAGWSCSNGPALITSWSGTPTAYGIGLRDHLRTLARDGTSATEDDRVDKLARGPFQPGPAIPEADSQIRRCGSAPRCL
ncbi:MAG: cellulase family glycosylhydrolase [Candidatus Dormiibacterota bacterium]